MFEKFNDEIVQNVWEKAVIVPGSDPAFKRKDICGAWIERNMYGVRTDQNNSGWEIDHIKPHSEGGTDDLSNLRPLQWYNNASRQNGPLVCRVSANNDFDGGDSICLREFQGQD